MKKKVELTEAEWAIMKSVWEHQPCAAPTIQEELEPSRGWSYSTVRTLMDRMVGKGLLRAEKLRNLTLYRSMVTEAAAQEGEVGYALTNAFNGALTPMVHCLIDSHNLSSKELKELEAWIRRKRQKKQKLRKN